MFGHGRLPAGCNLTCYCHHGFRQHIECLRVLLNISSKTSCLLLKFKGLESDYVLVVACSYWLRSYVKKRKILAESLTVHVSVGGKPLHRISRRDEGIFGGSLDLETSFPTIQNLAITSQRACSDTARVE
ncbi:hypothetical protein PHLGIDRAFT_201760 [Phlebiopsis gigantea 11061_1 CR5-6]|uniref:Uncharacterized protein n=1 Tax=Phlebiopsis gigantea (strain 11061_1 CR5-6) TaxID=745531 RepID=A0A0C3PFH4_PHLG1|nr:hypothetical protein PHLGIDRAFT_201760 [Phlebiopsis gigantea 11061_1 CR5-6]